MTDYLDNLTLHWSRIVEESYQDGPDGPRAVMWVSGCSIQCPGCQNKSLWFRRPEHRTSVSVATNALRSAAPDGRPVTITGGEPLDQVIGLMAMLTRLRTMDALDYFPRRHIILYTGYTWAHINHEIREGDAALAVLIQQVDVIVDGPYVESLDNDGMQWRGSSNQRAIDVQATLLSGPDYVRHPVTLDWDTAQMVQIVDGNLILTGGAAEMLGLNGAEVNRCGQADG